LSRIDGDAASGEESETIDDLAETLAQAAGDPRILRKNKLQTDINRLENRERLHTFGIYDARERARLSRGSRNARRARGKPRGSDAKITR
jgi:hypothetical protein